MKNEGKIEGTIVEIGAMGEFRTREGKTMARRTLTLDSARYNMDTGRRYENSPQIECSGAVAESLNNYRAGDRVVVTYELRGTAYTDAKTGQRRIFTRIYPYRLELLKSGTAPATNPAPSPSPAPNPILAAGGYGNQQLM